MSVATIRVLIIFIFLLAQSVSMYSQSAGEDWNFVNEDEGISVYTRHNELSAIKEIRIILTVETTMEDITELLANVPLYADWVYKCDDSFLLKHVSEEEFHYYITMDFPFPFWDRDLAVHSKHWIDPENGAYHSHSVTSTDSSYTNEEFVHITEFESHWHITPVGNGQLSIDYTALSNPGGDIPIWLVNMAITKGPLETMRRFARQVEIEKKKKSLSNNP
ncbi:MAG: hypothetical protein ACJA08_003063 [Cyclobacteriaceae bacterium]|jgi:hypothetical protein